MAESVSVALTQRPTPAISRSKNSEVNVFRTPLGRLYLPPAAFIPADIA